MLKSYRAVLVSLSLLLVFVLSGCSNAAPIDAHSTGIWDQLLCISNLVYDSICCSSYTWS